MVDESINNRNSTIHYSRLENIWPVLPCDLLSLESEGIWSDHGITVKNTESLWVYLFIFCLFKERHIIFMGVPIISLLCFAYFPFNSHLVFHTICSYLPFFPSPSFFFSSQSSFLLLLSISFTLPISDSPFSLFCPLNIILISTLLSALTFSPLPLLQKKKNEKDIRRQTGLPKCFQLMSIEQTLSLLSRGAILPTPAMGKAGKKGRVTWGSFCGSQRGSSGWRLSWEASVAVGFWKEGRPIYSYSVFFLRTLEK